MNYRLDRLLKQGEACDRLAITTLLKIFFLIKKVGELIRYLVWVVLYLVGIEVLGCNVPMAGLGLESADAIADLLDFVIEGSHFS